MHDSATTVHDRPLSERVMDTLDERHLTPKPRWQFLFHTWVVRAVAACAFLTGSLATALTIYIVQASQFMEFRIEFSRLDTLFEMVPFVWLCLVGVGVFYAVYGVRHTGTGYRYRSGVLVVGALFASIAGGVGLHASGVSEMIDRYLLVAAPLYGPMAGFQPHHWMRPPEGIIAGTVTMLDTPVQQCMVRDLKGTVWTVHLASSTVWDDAVVREGMRIRVVGTTTGSGMFEAFEIRPFHGRGGVLPQRPLGELPPTMIIVTSSSSAR